MKYFSLFSGIGGFELGIMNAYVEITDRNSFRSGKKDQKKDAADREGLEPAKGKRNKSKKRRPIELPDWSNDPRAPHCVGYSEIDKHAIKIYEKYFKHKNYGDITKIRPRNLPDFDLLIGGFPCQSFSIAGKRKGFEDTRGTLFFEIARIVAAKRPRLLLLENVKGLLSHERGETFAIILRTLDGLGYDLQWQVLNSKNFGVPQNRERVFIVGHLRGTARPQIFPIQENDNEDIILPTITTRVAADSNGTYVGKRSPRQIISGSQADRVYDPRGISTTLASQSGGLGAKTGLYAVGGLQAHQKPRKDGVSPTLTQAMGMGGGQTPIVWSKKIKIRRLTPTECERLQGFPDGWTADVSDTQRYKCLGNAVTVNVIKTIIEKLIRSNFKIPL